MSLTHQAHADRDGSGRPLVRIALLGCGTVGSGVARLLIDPAAAVAVRSGIDFWLEAIAVRSVAKPRSAEIPSELFTEDAARLVEDPQIHVVIECIGGTGVAATLVERALANGKHVVTANKDLLATRGPELRLLASRSGVTIQYEAAVGGAIPIVRTIADSLAGEHILEVGGVLNGTTNFILGEMGAGASYESALEQAQRLGYAEADPTNDVEGIDTAHKLAILAQLAFRRALVTPNVPRTGITKLGREDLSLAKRLDMTVKLVACARLGGSLVTPAYVRRSHPFAQGTGAQNCIRVMGQSSGSLTFAGTGAGGAPTASSVIGDVVAVLRHIETGIVVGAVADHTLTNAWGVERTIPLRRIVRLVSLRDARPAREALRSAGVAAEQCDGVPAILTTQALDASNDDLRALLRAHDLAAESILPLWEDLPAEATVAPAQATAEALSVR